jgi:hypothetical protein
MKKVKLMLLSLSILAVVGGALAFTAKTGQKFCTAKYTNACPQKCPTPAQLKDGSSSDFVCTTPTTNDIDHPCDVSGVALDCGPSVNQTIE